MNRQSSINILSQHIKILVYDSTTYEYQSNAIIDWTYPLHKIVSFLVYCLRMQLNVESSWLAECIM